MTELRPETGAKTRVELAREAAFLLGAMQVRPVSSEVVVDGKAQSLQPRVMQVLVALARRRGEVVSRDDLVASCWDGLAVSEDAISRCIGALRRLSEQTDGAHFVIETLAKVGYRMASPDTAPSDPSRVTEQKAAVSIAVLPFVNMSADPEQDYFSDGLSEEMMTQLTQIKELRVTGRTSSFVFKGRTEDLRMIGQTLGVAHILEGSVRKAGNRLRITAQLTKCADGFQMWSNTYDRNLVDVFAIQDEIARAVAQSLRVTLGVGSESLQYGGTNNFDAYDQFLKGRALFRNYTNLEEQRVGIDHLKRAVALDSGFSLAWASLADRLSLWRTFAPRALHEELDAERKAAARRALELSPDMAAALAVQGWIEADARNFAAADRSYQRAIMHGAGQDPVVAGNVGGFLTATGRVREGLSYRESARDSDPLSLSLSERLVNSYLTLGMDNNFAAEYARSKELQGSHASTDYLELMRLLLTRAAPEKISALFDTMMSDQPLEFIRDLSKVQASRDKALAVLRNHLDTPSWHRFALAPIAGAYGDSDLALEALERVAPTAGTAQFQHFWQPGLSAARKDPRFKALMREVGLAQFWRDSGKWPDFARAVGDDDFECW